MAVNLNRNPTAIICLSPNSGGMELDAIKLAKKLSPYMHITIIAKENHFIANSNADYVGCNGIELETIPFIFSLSPSIIFRVRRIIQEKGIKNIIFFGASELKSLYFSFLGHLISSNSFAGKWNCIVTFFTEKLFNKISSQNLGWVCRKLSIIHIFTFPTILLKFF